MKNKLPLIPPPPGGAVQPGEDEPRKPVVQMLAPESDSDFEESLPQSTAQTADAQPKRKRRTKEEMAALRGESAQPAAVVSDPALDRAKRKFTSLGAGQTIKAGFIAAKKPLERSEQEDVDDYFLLVGAKGGLDPTQSWIAMFFCALLLLCRLVFVRTDLGDHLKDIFFPPAKKENEGEGKGDAKIDSN